MPPFFLPWTPPADVYHAGNHWLIKIELAGISRDEVEFLVQGATLRVRGRRRDMMLNTLAFLNDKYFLANNRDMGKHIYKTDECGKVNLQDL